MHASTVQQWPALAVAAGSPQTHVCNSRQWEERTWPTAPLLGRPSPEAASALLPLAGVPRRE